jgi:hypothetical protein
MKKTVSLLSALITVLLCFSSCSGFSQKLDWNSLDLGGVIPQPDSRVCEIFNSTEKKLNLDAYNTSYKKFEKYADACQNAGFVVEAERDSGYLHAFNSEGYQLELNLMFNDIMSICLLAPENYGSFKWPNTDAAKTLPVPTSSIGKTQTTEEGSLEITVAETPFEAYKEYVSLCKETGYIYYVDESEKSFYAKNDDRYVLFTEYLGNNVMRITVREPEYIVSIEIENVAGPDLEDYDIGIYADDIPKGILTDGETKTYDIMFRNGVYSLYFECADNPEIISKVEFNINSEKSMTMKIFRYGSKIEVQNYESEVISTPAEPRETTEPVVEESHSEDLIVWINEEYGVKYHMYSGCGDMSDPVEMPKETAVKKGYSRCGRCFG